MGDAEHYTSTARALAAQYDDDSDQDTTLPSFTHDRRRTSSPLWTRRSADNPASSSRSRTLSTTAKWIHQAEKFQTRGLRLWNNLSPVQRVGLVAFILISIVLTILAITFSERIFHWLSPYAKRWHDLPAGWLILWTMTFFVSFPPMIGYSTCVTIGGFVFGMKGWFILASATIVGSTASFLVSRTVLKRFVTNMAAKNQQFAALSLVLKHDGLKLLCMIRLCPLPYSFSNGAISTIPTVTWSNFMLATALASPKLLLHVFVGTKLGQIAEAGEKMDAKTKAINYATLIIGITLGVVTGYVIYARTKARAMILEAEEIAAARRSSRLASGEYVDEDERDAVEALRERQSDVSLHTTYEDAERMERGAEGYTDESTDEEEMARGRDGDVFGAGDGEEEVKEGAPYLGRKKSGR